VSSVSTVHLVNLFRLSRQASQTAVREMLGELVEALAARNIDTDLQGSVQIAVAEALNNVVEHAYADKQAGPVTLSADLGQESLHITITDTGAPLPGGRIPACARPDLSVPQADLPEGGFGWFLIHDLARDLSYSRKSGTNTLRIGFFRDSPAQKAAKT